jgi:hypothetical protein
MVRLVPMTEDELELHLEKSIPEYAADNVAAGYWSEEEALERSRKAFHGLLPQGVNTENNYLFRIQVEESGEKIGTLWMKHEVPRPRVLFTILPLTKHSAVKATGARLCWLWKMSLRGWKSNRWHCTFSQKNKVAKGLYESLGYEVTSQNMAKRLKR